jgi:glycosyltransferase involved in cell wall biosynthesis
MTISQSRQPELAVRRKPSLRVLLVIEQCDPEATSVPLVGFQYFDQVSRLVETTLVTHVRNRQALDKVAGSRQVFYITERRSMAQYYRLVSRLTERGGVNWPLRHALSYPVYAHFDRQVFRQFAAPVEAGRFDVVHAFTPVIPRYPYGLVNACHDTPFVLGPVNGGLPYPNGFHNIGQREHDSFNVLRRLGYWIPGYSRTYHMADRVLVGSSATLGLVQRMFALPEQRLTLFHENGVTDDFSCLPHRAMAEDTVELLFVGRLVPYKCADVVIEALHRLAGQTHKHIRLTVVGDGPERDRLEQLATELGVSDRVRFAGLVPQRDTVHFYRQADIFCFPSIREFGGAVVMEAMACGLPCIVADYGGIAEYVTEDTGLRLALSTRERLVADLADGVRRLIEDEALRLAISAASRERARHFRWQNKADDLVRIYEQVVEEKRTRARLS